MAGARRELAVAHRVQFAPECVARDGKLKLIPDPLRQIGKSPAHHAVRRRDRSRLDRRNEPVAPLIVQDKGPSRRLARDQAIRTALVEPNDPVAHNL